MFNELNDPGADDLNISVEAIKATPVIDHEHIVDLFYKIRRLCSPITPENTLVFSLGCAGIFTYDVIVKRLGDYSKRGVVLRPDQTLFDLYQERCALYEKYADIVIDCSGNDYPTYQKRAYYAILGTLGKL